MTDDAIYAMMSFVFENIIVSSSWLLEDGRAYRLDVGRGSRKHLKDASQIKRKGRQGPSARDDLAEARAEIRKRSKERRNRLTWDVSMTLRKRES